MTEPSDVSVTSAPPARVRARNGRLSAAWAVLAVATATYFAIRTRTLPGMICLPIALYALFAAAAAYRGVVVDAASLSAPKIVFRTFPLVAFGRITIPIGALRDATSLGSFMGFQVVGLTIADDQLPVLFARRAQKLAFFDALKAIDPTIRIYRTY
jgi:hypothetical protein